MGAAARVWRPLQIHAAPDPVRPMHGTVKQRRDLTRRNSGRDHLSGLGDFAGRSRLAFQNFSLGLPGALIPDVRRTYAQGIFEWK